MAVLADLASSNQKYRIFVSYSHDSEEHRLSVKTLADTIGLLPDTDCVIDQYVPGEHPVEGWPRWMEQQFELATRVLCICTERYSRLVVNDVGLDGREGRGVHWESELFLAELYREKSTSKKIKAILRVGENPDVCIPRWLIKWGWLSFPTSIKDPAFQKLKSYIFDAVPAPGPGLPEEYVVEEKLSASDRDFIARIRRDTIAAVENVKLLGMAKPVKLLDLYYPAVLSTTIARRLYESEWKRVNAEEPVSGVAKGARRKASLASYVIGSDYIEACKRVVVLGGPGAGKTTFLKSLALRYSGAMSWGIGDREFSLFVHLPTASKAEVEILEWLDREFGLICADYRGKLLKLCAASDVTILLDSLDEVPVAARAQTLERIKVLERQLPDARIVISCRTADYHENLDNYNDVEVARLSSDAITKIVRAWFNDDAEGAKRLLDLISGDDGVKSLTETPLLLSLLCIQFRHDLDLPKRKAELYSRCISVLLRDWDAGRKFRRKSNYEQLTDDRKTKLFEFVAGHFMHSGERYDLPVEETRIVVGGFLEKCGVSADLAREVLSEIESLHGVIERLSRDHYCFSHNTLQEYFAASRVVATRDELRVVQDHLHEEAWEPVVEFIAGMLDEPFPVFELLMRASKMEGLSNYPAMAKRTKVLSLLYKCLCSSPLLSASHRNLVVDHLVQAHYHMAKIYGAGGVYPFAVLKDDGIAHTYFWTSKRPTLAEALKPFRRLSNLIYMNPVPEYANAVLKSVDSQAWRDALIDRFGKTTGRWILDNLEVSLLVPIAKSSPDNVVSRLQRIVDNSGMYFVRQSVKESIGLIGAKHSIK